MDDLEAINELITACALATDGTDAFTEPWQRSDWTPPALHMTTGAWVVSAPDGQMVGFAAIRPRAMGHFRAEVYVHPRQQGQNIGSQLLQLSETRARQMAQPLPADLPIALVQKISSTNTAAKQLLEQNSYRSIYHNWQMVIDFSEAPPAPVWPTGITVRPCIPGQDERTIYAVTTETFAELVTFEEWATVRLQPKKFLPDLWCLASAGAEVAGVVLGCYVREMGWVNILAVRPAWQKQGLGMALLRHAFGEFYRRGTRKVGLSVDSQNTSGATRLYERAGMRIARQDDRYEKTLRTSKELSRGLLAE
jgi:mycothiol synthase